MSKQSEKLFDGITQIPDALAEQAQAAKTRRPRRLRILAPIAAVLALAVLAGVIFGNQGLIAYAISGASYPSQSQRVSMDAYQEGMAAFLTATVPEFLSGHAGENAVYSPLNVYMALSMLAEVTDGEARAQLLALLGSADVQTQREKAKALWNNHYWSDEQTKSLLANSLWLSEDLSYQKQVLDTLAAEYYASSFRGRMGAEGYDKALRKWINEQTNDLLKDQAAGLGMSPLTILALVSTIYFKASWGSEFDKAQTCQETFHAPTGDMTCDFLHGTRGALYAWGEGFTAASLGTNSPAAMLLILPDEGTSPEALLENAELLAFLSGGAYSKNTAENRTYTEVNFTVPKFDVASDQDLCEGLERLGVTAVFDAGSADFSPLTSDPAYVSQIRHAARLRIDEEGCEGAAYTVVNANTTESPAEEREPVDFVADRPFLFLVCNNDGLPMFVGIVNQP